MNDKPLDERMSPERQKLDSWIAEKRYNELTKKVLAKSRQLTNKDLVEASRMAMEKLCELEQLTSEKPTAEQRKQHPVYSGVLKYFPDAIMAVANCSYVGGEQHHPGEPLHWDRSKSGDEADALVRHLIQAGTVDTDGIRHTAKVAWRGLSLLQREIESEKGNNNA